jgi:hypothetical protein
MDEVKLVLKDEALPAVQKWFKDLPKLRKNGFATWKRRSRESVKTSSTQSARRTLRGRTLRLSRAAQWAAGKATGPVRRSSAQLD